MRRSMLSGLFALACVAFAAAACEDTVPTTPTPPPATEPTTETFSGVLTLNGAQTFSFNVAAAGTLTATLKTVAPDSTIAVGMGLGTYFATTCAVVSGLFNDNALQGSVITGQAGSSGTLCVRVSDVGKLTEPVSFEIVVVHP
jgi:hypothetical protein